MPDQAQSISELPAASSVGTSDIFPIVQGGVTKSGTVAQALANVPAPPDTLAALTDVDQTTVGANKILSVVTSGGKPFSFQTPAGAVALASDTATSHVIPTPGTQVSIGFHSSSFPSTKFPYGSCVLISTTDKLHAWTGVLVNAGSAGGQAQILAVAVVAGSIGDTIANNSPITLIAAGVGGNSIRTGSSGAPGDGSSHSAITFTDLQGNPQPFIFIPPVVLPIVHGNPGTPGPAGVVPSVSDVTLNGFNLWATGGTSATASIDWVAIGQPI